MRVCKNCKKYGLFSGRCSLKSWPCDPNNTCGDFDSAIQIQEDKSNDTLSLIKSFNLQLLLDINLRDYQESVIGDLQDRNLICWPRNSGKTFIIATVSIYEALINSNHKVLISAPNTKMLESVIKYITNIYDGISEDCWEINNHGIKKPKYKSFWLTPYAQAIFDNGSSILCIPASSRAFSGFTANHVLVDEATQIEDAPIKTRILPLVSSNKDTKLTCFFTPAGCGGYIERLFNSPPFGYKCFKQ